MVAMYDAIAPLAVNIPADAQVVAGYVEGPYQWTVETFRRFARARFIGIALNAGTTDGHVLDIETGAATPDQAPRWVERRLADGLPRATLYCGYSNWPRVRAAILVAGLEHHVDYWLADPTGKLHIAPGTIGTQWAWWKTAAGQSLYDQSEMLAIWWPLAGLEPTAPVERADMIATDPTTGGTWTLEPDGSVWAAGGAPYLGGIHDGNHGAGPITIVGAIVGIAARLYRGTEWGYVIVTREGTPIGPNPVGADPADIHRYYQFLR